MIWCKAHQTEDCCCYIHIVNWCIDHQLQEYACYFYLVIWRTNHQLEDKFYFPRQVHKDVHFQIREDLTMPFVVI